MGVDRPTGCTKLNVLAHKRGKRGLYTEGLAATYKQITQYLDINSFAKCVLGRTTCLAIHQTFLQVNSIFILACSFSNFYTYWFWNDTFPLSPQKRVPTSSRALCYVRNRGLFFKMVFILFQFWWETQNNRYQLFLYSIARCGTTYLFRVALAAFTNKSLPPGAQRN